MINALSKKRVGGRGVNLNLDNVFKYTRVRGTDRKTQSPLVGPD